MLDTRLDGGPAFPASEFGNGMSLRDWFAGQALIGLLAYSPADADAGQMPEKGAAMAAYEYADAMLAERKKATEQPANDTGD